MTAKTHFIYIAPSNSTQKEIADFICDGSNDSQQINSAISSAKAGTEIILLDGKFNITEKINLNKPDLTISGTGYSTVVEQVNNNNTTSIIFDISADRIKIKEMMLVDVDVDYPQYIIRSSKEVAECEFKRIFFILKSQKNNIDSYIDISGLAVRFYDCRVYSYSQVPNKMTINIIGYNSLISGMINTGNDSIKINFSNKSYYLFGNDNLEVFVNKIKQ